MGGRERRGRRGAGPAAGSRAVAVAAAAAVVAGALASAPGTAAAQSTVDRTPNLTGIWAPSPGVVHFHFLHRFEVTPAPARKVLNSPTILLAAGLPAGLLAGGRYATNSLLVPGEPNAWELFARWSPPSGAGGMPVDVALEAARNWAARSWDGELLLGRDVGPLRLLAGGRAFSSFAGSGDARWAAVAGARIRLLPHVAVAGDVARVVDDDALDAAWSAGLQLEIPYTPHSLSLQVSNANTTTLQGASVGVGDRRWGFEFTVPITLSRYFGGRKGDRAAAGASAGQPGTRPPGAAPTAGETATVVEMDNRLRFLPDTIRIRAGETVTWRNTSDLIHTVTADPDAAALDTSVRLPSGAAPFNSGDLKPGETFRHTFTEPGEYRYFCIPHERAGMVGTVVVEP